MSSNKRTESLFVAGNRVEFRLGNEEPRLWLAGTLNLWLILGDLGGGDTELVPAMLEAETTVNWLEDVDRLRKTLCSSPICDC